ncbi:MAG: bifunctional phosphopantothenoylcysteine decarboxylase/phosphopantothenate--cysteine ligase CoaBC [Rikenellaceae bacterium]|jgi:phosphopantothenoylcysteine decarboxylase/phosphopantothenate--cysteine ligase|nr:bifunctional phosphopantothenoylcysteine decarboxylase/phosphopantothenate--cysteine ligase CoaBC [Rikenellaceae bacterium]
MLNGKNILVGITGSIAAYKAAILVRSLVREGAQVRVVMTPLAKEFITPLTLATLSKNPIAVDFFDPENGAWNSHVSLGEWADAYLIAPASANTLAKMAHGVADNLLLTTYLSAKCPVLVAPAMDLDMYAHPATQANLETLRQRGCRVIEPEVGELASGLVGKGRMAEPEAIVEYLRGFLTDKGFWSGKRVLVTAGGTVEPIDPVRFISNYSSGKMGYAVAEELSNRGAEVVLVKGRVSVATHNPHIREIEALSAEEMYRVCTEEFPRCDAAVMAAAVADYTPAQVSDHKIKKNNDAWSLHLTRTRDIAAALGAEKNGRLLVGFALETDNELVNAEEKMRRKNFDLIVLNSPNVPGAAFGHDTNKVTILCSDGMKVDYGLKPKNEVATDIITQMERRLANRK